MTKLYVPSETPDAAETDAGKRARSKAANRRAILAAGRKVFARIGFEAATVRDIIRETDLAAGTFYNYFKSKEDVFEAIAEDSTHRFRERLSYVRAKAATLESYINDAYRAYFEFIAEEHGADDASAVIIGVRVDTPEMQALADEIRSDLEHILSRKGAPDLDVDYLTAAAIGIAREMADRMLLRRPVDPEAATQFAASLILTAVSAMTARAR